MNKQELLNKELYTIVSRITEIPYIMDGKFFVIYSDKEKAIRLADKLNENVRGFYREMPMMVCSITDCDGFFNEMIYLGFPLFLYDGEGKIHNLSEICEVDYVLPEKEKAIYAECMGLMRMSQSTHIGKVKQANIARAKVVLHLEENRPIVNQFNKRQNELKKCYTLNDTSDQSPKMPETVAVMEQMTDYPEFEGGLEAKLGEPDAVADVDSVQTTMYYPKVYQQPRDKYKSYGMISMICGIASLLFFPFTAIVGIVGLIFGIMSISHSKKTGQEVEEKAIAGVVMCGFWIGVAALIFVGAVVYGVISGVIEAFA